MKKKFKALILSLVITVSSLPFSGTIANAEPYDYQYSHYPYEIISSEYYSQEIEWDLWERFLKYDLCITDYEALTDDQKELCKFIFETERSAEGTVRCQRARLALSGEFDLGDRYTVEQAYNHIFTYEEITDENDLSMINDETFTYCQPDIKHIDEEFLIDEFWLNDEGTERILTSGYATSLSYNFRVYLRTGEEEKTWYEENYHDYSDNPRVVVIDEYTFYLVFSENEVWYGEWIEYPSLKQDFSYIESSGFYYKILRDGTATIYGCTSDNPMLCEETFSIPEVIDGYTVTAILRFYGGDNVTQVELPDTVTHIYDNAFHNNKSIQSINFPESLEYIGELAFGGCSNLNTIEINCPILTIADMAFQNSGIKEANLTAKNISDYAFNGCTSLEKVTLNEGLEKIGVSTFGRCSSLTTVQLPSSLKFIGQNAFGGTTISDLTIPSTVKVLGTLKARYGHSLSGSGLFDNPANDPLTEKGSPIVNSDCIINGYYSTEAHLHAIQHGLKFNPLNENVAYGDVNLDGEIGVADAVLLQSTLTGKDVVVGFEADLVIDGIIDSFDFISIRNMLVS